MNFGTKEMAGAGAVLLLLVGAYGVTSMDTSSGGSQTCQDLISSVNNSGVDNWRNYELVDVNECEKYSISELEKPLLVETFAVWCSICLKQQNNVKEFHKNSEVKSVALDIDPNEDAEKVRSHTERHGFEWRYSVAPAQMTQDMVDKFGGAIRIPPRAPMVLVCEEGARKLPDGVKPVSKLEEEVEKGC